MELLTAFLVIVIIATTSAKPTGWSRHHHDADIADNDLSTLLEMHTMRSSESWQSSQSSESRQSSQSSESRQSSQSSESETSESNSFSQQDPSDSSESSEEDDSDSSEESSEEVIIVIPVLTTTPGLESPSTATTPTVDAMTTTTLLPTPVPEGMSTGGPTMAPPLTTHDVTLPGTEFTPCVTHNIVTPTHNILTPAPVTESRGDN